MSSPTNMPQHGKNCMFLPSMKGRTPIKHQRRLLLLLLSHKKGRCPQYLIHRVLHLIKETHLRRNQPSLEWTMRVSRPRIAITAEGHLGPLYHHKIKGNRHLPVFTFDFSGTPTSGECGPISPSLRPWSLEPHQRLRSERSAWKADRLRLSLPCLQ